MPYVAIVEVQLVNSYDLRYDLRYDLVTNVRLRSERAEVEVKVDK